MMWHVFNMLDIRAPIQGYGKIFDTLQQPRREAAR